MAKIFIVMVDVVSPLKGTTIGHPESYSLPNIKVAGNIPRAGASSEAVEVIGPYF